MILKSESNQPHYQSLNVGTVTVTDIRDGMTKKVSMEEYRECDYYESISKGLVVATDTRDGRVVKITKDEYNTNSYYEAIISGKTILRCRFTQIHRSIDSNRNRQIQFCQIPGYLIYPIFWIWLWSELGNLI